MNSPDSRVKTIRVKWGMLGDGSKMDPYTSFEYKVLSRRFNVQVVDENPEYMICDVQTYDDLENRGCVKIVRTIENNVPDFNRYDYAMGFNHLTFGDRYQRVPLWSVYRSYEALKDRAIRIPSNETLLRRKFCSFVVSNSGNVDPLRDYFFKQLSEYKTVDSGGRHLNNIGGPVADKLDFCSRYKFNIAFENSSVPGYTTEKIMEPLSVYSVPIYYGDPLVTKDFTPECMVEVKSKRDVDRAIQEIISLDQDDAAYLKKCAANALVHDWDYYAKQRELFLLNIFDQPLENARRTVDFGFQGNMRERLLKMNKIFRVARVPRDIGLRVKHLCRMIVGR